MSLLWHVVNFITIVIFIRLHLLPCLTTLRIPVMALHNCLVRLSTAPDRASFDGVIVPMGVWGFAHRCVRRGCVTRYAQLRPLWLRGLWSSWLWQAGVYCKELCFAVVLSTTALCGCQRPQTVPPPTV